MGINSLHSDVVNLAAQRHFRNTNASLATSVERLSSGHRINGAADDAGGLGISQRLHSQIRGMSIAQRNAEDAVNILGIAEAATSTGTETLQRMRELAVQASSEGITDTERLYLDKEFAKLDGEFTRSLDATKYNGQKLLDGSYANKTFQVGADNGVDFRLKISLALFGLPHAGSAIATLSEANDAIDFLDQSLDAVNSLRSDIGAKMANFETAAAQVAIMRENLVSANSRIEDTAIAAEVSNATRSQVMLNATASVLAQANAHPEQLLSLLR